jgi:hypothetical protein
MKRWILVVVASLLVGFGPLEKREKEAISGSGTLSVPRAFWPAFGLEYEGKVTPRFGAAAFVSAGRFDPLLFRFLIRDTPAYQLSFNHWRVGARANAYVMGDFHHGMMVGITGQVARASYTTVIENEGYYDAWLISVLGGPHVGYKLILSPGLTVQVVGGVGYNYLTDATLTQNDLETTDDFPRLIPPVAPFGDVSVGWSF